jgi:opacity protein-like surface antigen
MKKLMIFVGALTLTGSLFAQKPAADDAHFSLEGLANLNSSEGMSFLAPSLRLRYFINDKFAARIQFGFAGDGSSVVGLPSKETTYYFNQTKDKSGTIEVNRSAIDFKLGAEYHLPGTDRMSPYFSAMFGFGNGKEAQNWTNVFYETPGNPASELVYIEGFTVSANGSYTTNMWGLGAGFDYYVADNIYLGLELNLTSQNTQYGNKQTEITDPTGAVMSIDQPGNSKTETNIGAAHGSVRIGWRF